MPRISVIVPVYKVELYLHRCVDSILAQTYRDFELILVDDGSPDNCPAICDEYAKNDSRIVVIHQINGGLSAARNSGIEWAITNSECQYLAFIDSDDWVHKQYLEQLLWGIENNNAEMSSCLFERTSIFDLGIINNDLKDVRFGTFFPEDYVTLEYGDWRQNNWWYNLAWGKLFSKRLFMNLRFPVGKLHEDIYTTYKAIFASRNIAMTEIKLYYYFVNPNSITESKWNIRRLDSPNGYREQMFWLKEHGFHKAYCWVLAKYFDREAFAVQKLHELPEHKELLSTHLNRLKEDYRKYGKDVNLCDVYFDKVLFWTDHRRFTLRILLRKIRRKLKNILHFSSSRFQVN